MKLLIKLIIVGAIAVIASCSAVDVAVDRSQLKAQTSTHDVYPSTAVTPVVNEEELEELFREGVDKANAGLSEVIKKVEGDK